MLYDDVVDISKNTIRNIIDDFDATKFRGPNGIPPVFLRKDEQESLQHHAFCPSEHKKAAENTR